MLLPVAISSKKTKDKSAFFYSLLHFLFTISLHFPQTLCSFSEEGLKLSALSSDLSCVETFLKKALLHVFLFTHQNTHSPHLTWTDSSLPSSSSPLYSPPLLSVPPLLGEPSFFHIKAPRSLSSVREASALMRKVQREHNNNRSSSAASLPWNYSQRAARASDKVIKTKHHMIFLCFVCRNNRKQ